MAQRTPASNPAALARGAQAHAQRNRFSPLSEHHTMSEPTATEQQAEQVQQQQQSNQMIAEVLSSIRDMHRKQDATVRETQATQQQLSAMQLENQQRHESTHSEMHGLRQHMNSNAAALRHEMSSGQHTMQQQQQQATQQHTEQRDAWASPAHEQQCRSTETRDEQRPAHNAAAAAGHAAARARNGARDGVGKRSDPGPHSAAAELTPSKSVPHPLPSAAAAAAQGRAPRAAERAPFSSAGGPCQDTERQGLPASGCRQLRTPRAAVAAAWAHPSGWLHLPAHAHSAGSIAQAGAQAAAPPHHLSAAQPAGRRERGSTQQQGRPPPLHQARHQAAAGGPVSCPPARTV